MFTRTRANCSPRLEIEPGRGSHSVRQQPTFAHFAFASLLASLPLAREPRLVASRAKWMDVTQAHYFAAQVDSERLASVWRRANCSAFLFYARNVQNVFNKLHFSSRLSPQLEKLALGYVEKKVKKLFPFCVQSSRPGRKRVSEQLFMTGALA